MTTYNVSSGATSTGITLRRGDFLYVSSGGTADDITVDSGTTEYVFSGGTSSDTTVHSGGAEFVYSTGSAIDTTLSTGGYLIVLSGGVQSGTVRSGGAVVSTGVVLEQPVSGVTVYSGVASGVAVGNGAVEYVLSDGTTSNTTVDNGGYEAVGIGGTAVGTVVSDGGYEQVSGGTSSDTTVHSGGFLSVSAGGATVSTVVDSAGTEHVYDGGTTSDTTLSSSGTEYVFPAGSTVSTAVDRGGTEVVYGGGTSISTTVSSGGTEIVDPGGAERDTVVSSGGNLVEPTRAGSGGLVIDVSYDASVAGAPAGFETTVNAAVAYLESQFATPITITIDVGYGEVGGENLTGDDLGESTSEGIYVSYSQLRSALLSRTATSDEIAAAAGLPVSDPAPGDAEYFSSYAEAEALGLSSGPGVGVAVGAIGLGSTSPFTYGTTNAATSGSYDAFGVIEHEITEVMGRTDSLGGGGFYSPLDLFRYASAGVRDLTPASGYFSVNGSDLLYQFNNPSNGGDAGDWASSVPDDSFDAFASEGVANPVSPTDLRVMDVIGYTPASAGSTIAVWSNPISADWDTALDWSDGIVPNSTTIGVVLSQLGTYTVSVAAGESFTAGAVTVSSSGGTLLVDGTITVAGTSLPDGNLVVGKNQGDNATLVIGSTGTVIGAGTIALEIGSGLDANGTVMVNGGTLNGIDGIDVGEAGLGHLDLNGGVTNAGTNAIEIGAQSGAAGAVGVGQGGELEAGSLLVGISGGGDLDVSDGGQVDLTGTGNVNVGAAPGGSGTVEINSGALFDADGYFSVGNANASGTLLVASGGTLTTSGTNALGDIDTTGTGHAAATVSGTWIVDGPILVGNTGAGTLVVQSGGLVDATELLGGVGSTGNGGISVTGTASALTLSGALVVGDASLADLSILSGATVTAQNAVLGLNVGGTGVVDLAGTGSELDLTNSLNMAGAGTGTLVMGANTTLAIANNFVVGSNDVLQQSGGVLDPANLTNTGSVTGGGGAVANVGSTLLNDGGWAATLGDDTVNVGAPGAGGGLVGGSIDGTGSLVIGNGGDLIVSAATVLATQSVVFTNSGTTGVLTIGTLAGFSAVIDSFAPQAEILLAGTSVVGDAFVANTLTLFGGGGVELGTLAFAADAVSGGYLTTSDGGIVEVRCFAAGTRIATARSEVSVEVLRVGDLVRTVLGEGHAGGGLAPVIWVGRREVDCAGHAEPRKVWPVRVAAGAFGPGQPHSELFLSPDHAVFVAEVLIPVRYLVNGSTIVQVPVERVTYCHVELEEHDVLLAQGLPAESFLDMRDGWKYASRVGPVRQYPDFTARMWEAFGCARLVVTGPELEAARAWVNGIVFTAAPRDTARQLLIG